MVGNIEVAAGAARRPLQQPGQQGQRARHAHEQLGIDRTGGGTATCTLPAGQAAYGESAGPQATMGRASGTGRHARCPCWSSQAPLPALDTPVLREPSPGPRARSAARCTAQATQRCRAQLAPAGINSITVQVWPLVVLRNKGA